MVFTLQEFEFDTLVNAVQDELSYRSNPHNPAAEPKANFVQHSRGENGRGRGKNCVVARNGLHRGTPIRRIEKRTCDYCHIQGHTYCNCWKRQREQDRTGNSRYGSGRHQGRPERGFKLGNQVQDTPLPRGWICNKRRSPKSWLGF